MEKYFRLIKLIGFLQIVHLATSQELNIIKIGTKNFANFNLFGSGDNALMMTTDSNETIFYDISGTTFNEYTSGNRFFSFHNGMSPPTYGYKTFSCQTFYYDPFLVTVSENNFVEIYNLEENSYLYVPIPSYFGYENIIEFGNGFPFYIGSTMHYVFPLIAENGIHSILVLYKVDISKPPYDYSSNVKYEMRRIKGKALNCFSIIAIPKIICLFLSENDELTLDIYNQYFQNESSNVLEVTSNVDGTGNFFFKGINFDETQNRLVIAYYTSYEDNYLRFIIKDYSIYDFDKLSLSNYNKNKILIDANGFSKDYKMNDMVKLDNGDIYFAASSKDRESLNIIIFKINGYAIQKREFTIELWNKYRLKFYNGLKLVNNGNDIHMGFNNCDQKYCEDTSYHFTSLFVFNDFREEHTLDLVQHLYDTNINPNENIIIDFNVYKNDVFGRKLNYIQFIDIPEQIKLIIPEGNIIAQTGIMYHNSSFILNVAFNTIGSYTIKYTISLDDIFASSNPYLRRLYSLTNDVSIDITIDQIITNNCNDKCSLCPLNEMDNCISCKYNYNFAGGKKFCNEATNEMNSSQIEDIIENIMDNIENQEFGVIESDNALLQINSLNFVSKNTQKNMSSINLGECEGKLRESLGLTKEEEFIIIKLDLKNLDISATYVQYEIINPRTKKPVDLSICEDIPVTINTPVEVSEANMTLIHHLEKEGYDAFDIKNPFYNDICATYTAQNGADMIIPLRIDEIYNDMKEINLCQSGCTFGDFNSANSKSECICKIQIGPIIVDVTRLNFDKTQFLDSFYKTLYNSNFRVVKCAKLLFSSKGLKTNLGSYIMLLLIGAHIAFIVLSIITGKKRIIEIINKVLNMNGKEVVIRILKRTQEPKKEEEKKENKEQEKKEEVKKIKKNYRQMEPVENENENENIKEEDKKEKKVKKIYRPSEPVELIDPIANTNEEFKEEVKKERKVKKIYRPIYSTEKINEQNKEEEVLKMESSKSIKKEQSDIKIEELNAPPKKRSSKNYRARKSQTTEIKLETTNAIVVDTKPDSVDNEKNEKIETKEVNAPEENKQKEQEIPQTKPDVKNEARILEFSQGLIDKELNFLDFEKALEIDKRTFWQYYFSLLKSNQLFFFTFWPSEDYNLFPMKVLLFIISISLDFTINTFFFSDKTMSNIYYDDGKFYYINQVPNIMYSSLVSLGIEIVLRKLSLSQSKILSIKAEKDPEKKRERAKNVQNILNITLIIFIATSSVLMLFFWYFISCFCAVFINSQTILIKDTFTSFAKSNALPFVFDFLLAVFRIPALRYDKKNKCGKICYQINYVGSLIFV